MTHRIHIISLTLLLMAVTTLCCMPLRAQQHRHTLLPFGNDETPEVSVDEMKKASKKLYEIHQPLGIRYTEKHPLIIVADWMLRPYSFINDHGEPDGFYIDILKSIFENMHVPYELRMMDRHVARKALVDGTAHLMIDTWQQATDSSNVHYGRQVVGEYQLAVMHLKGEEHIRSLTLLDASDTVYTKPLSYGSFYINKLFSDNPPFNLGYRDPLLAQKQIMNKVIKYYIWDRSALLDITRRYGTRSLVDIDPIDIPVRKFRFASTDDALLHELDLQFMHLKENGRYKTIVNRWLTENITHDKGTSYMEILVIVTLLAIVVAVLFIIIIVQRNGSLANLKEEFRTFSQMAIDLTNCQVIAIRVSEMRVYNVSGDFFPPGSISYHEYESMIHPDDIQYEYQARQEVDGGKNEMPTVCFRMKKYGDTTNNWRSMRVHAYVKTNRRGKPVYIYLVMVDETDALEEQRRLDKTTKEFSSITDITDIGMIYFNKEGDLVNKNRFVSRLLEKGGADPARCEEFLSNSTLQEMLAVLGSGITMEKDMDVWFCAPLDIIELNLHTTIELRIQSVYDESKNHRGYAIAIFDIEENRRLHHEFVGFQARMARLKEELARYQMELRFILRRSKMNSFRWTVGNDYLEVSRDLFSFDYHIPLQKYYDAIIDDGKAAYAELLTDPARHFSKPIHTVRQYRALERGKHVVRWHTVNVIPEYDSNGRLCGAFGMFCNVTDFMLAQERLRKENAKSEDSGKQKAMFLSTMTHELRTPLNAINGFAEIMRIFSTPEEKEEYVGIMAHNCTILISLVDNILQLSVMDADGVTIKPEEVDFAKVFPEEVRKLSHYITNPDVRFLVDTPLSSLVVKVDMQKVMQIVDAVVNNASKFTERGFVRVGYRYINGMLTIYCRDSGSGIPQEHRDQLFDRFVKLNDYVQGIGLGLPICKIIADSMGATINVYSREGEGTTISLDINVTP